MINKYFGKIILFITLVIMFILPLSAFLTYIFANEKEFTPEEVQMLKNTSRIRIVVNASSWLERPKDVRSAIVANLGEFTLIPEEDKDYDAMMFVDYTEAKGLKIRAPVDEFETNIRCAIRIDHYRVGTVFAIILTASTPSMVKCPLGIPSSGCLRDNAFEKFVNQENFKNLGENILKKMKKR
jgi:hypothetical protein